MNFNDKTPARRPRTGQALSAPVGTDTHKSICKTCGATVFTWQKWRWRSTSPIGIVHYNCREGR